MKKWYEATCVVKLAVPLEISGLSQNPTVKETAAGYTVCFGLRAADIEEAAAMAAGLARAAFKGKQNNKEVEEIQIRVSDESMLSDQFKQIVAYVGDERIYQSGLIYFNS